MERGESKFFIFWCFYFFCASIDLYFYISVFLYFERAKSRPFLFADLCWVLSIMEDTLVQFSSPRVQN